MLRVGKQSEQRKAECSAVRQMHTRRDVVLAFQASNSGSAKPVIAEQNVTQAKNENADLPFRNALCEFAAHEWSVRSGRNL